MPFLSSALFVVYVAAAAVTCYFAVKTLDEEKRLQYLGQLLIFLERAHQLI